MPRIDPLQLLKCLSVLLSPDGGIMSRDEVPRLVNLMSKFCKKLVSKCVYVLILKNTDPELINMFMTEGGWKLIHTWLQDAMHVSNWDLVREILGLLLVTPVNVERLKLNNIPKLVKTLSRREDLNGIAQLSSSLVTKWLQLVKSNNNLENAPKSEESSDQVYTPENSLVNGVGDSEGSNEATSDNSSQPGVLEIKVELKVEDEKKEEGKEEEKTEKEKDRSKSKSSSKSSSSSSSSRSKDRDKDRKRSSSSSKSSSSSSSKDRHRDKDRKDKHRSNGSTKHSSSSKDKDRRDSKSKERQAEKDKETLSKIKGQTLEKLGKIPKKGEDKKEIKKKPTMSIEVRKGEDRPKTVKVYNAKMRSTGLEEEVKPPPPRSAAKKTPSVQLPTIPTKRPSPVKETAPPEKKIRMDIIDKMDRPGAIKLIPPKAKPAFLQESDIFMDALAASATTKKEPKKRKRRPSTSKESAPPVANATEQAAPPESPLGIKNIAPFNFYQDTLNNSDNGDSEKDNEEKGEEKTEDKDKDEAMETNEDEGVESTRVGPDGLKGVLVHVKKKGPKRSICWKADSDLVEVRYFELDETERVNVTKTFMDMAKMEMSSEREALQMSRKLSNDDVMEPQIMWRLPYFIELPEPLITPGCKSLEKDIQFAREKSVLQALYFDKRRIPDSPEEPIPENHQMSDPVSIPLEDSESQEIDLRKTPWPEPKGSPPHMENPIGPPIFPVPGPFNPHFQPMPPPNFQGIPPRFQGPGPNFVPPMMNNMMNDINPGPMNPMFNPNGDGFNENNFPMPFNQPPNMNVFPPNNFMNRPPMGMNRGGFRPRGGGNAPGPWIRMNGPPGPNWNRGGGAMRGGRFCKNIKMHGFCRNRDNCPFIHPN